MRGVQSRDSNGAVFSPPSAVYSVYCLLDSVFFYFPSLPLSRINLLFNYFYYHYGIMNWCGIPLASHPFNAYNLAE